MSASLAGRTVLVTGGTGGIGGAIAARLADAGGRVTVSDLGATPSGALPTGVDYVQADATSPEAMAEAVAAAAAGGRLDVCFANVGVFAEYTSFVDADPDDWQRTIAGNLTTALVTCRAAARWMLDQDPAGGVIVATSSVAGLRPEPECPVYSACKAGVLALVESLAVQLGRQGIRVNAIVPGPTETPTQLELRKTRGVDLDARLADASFDEVRTARHPLGRLATPEEVADAALFLASDEARYLNGASLVIDGGARLV